MFGCFWTNGQICSATSRLLVQQSIAPRLLARLVAETAKIPVINPNLAENKEKIGVIGPLVSAGQFAKVSGMVAGITRNLRVVRVVVHCVGAVVAAVKEGAQVLVGGRRSPSHEKGFYWQPTVLSVTPQVRGCTTPSTP